MTSVRGVARLGDDREAARAIRHGRDGAPSDQSVGTYLVLEVAGIKVTTGDDDQVGPPTNRVQLAVDDHADISGAEPSLVRKRRTAPDVLHEHRRAADLDGPDHWHVGCDPHPHAGQWRTGTDYPLRPGT